MGTRPGVGGPFVGALGGAPRVMPRTRWRRRAGGLWAGLLVATGAVGVVVYLRFPDVRVPALVLTLVVAVVAGVIGTVRMRKQDEEPLITVEDLRKER